MGLVKHKRNGSLSYGYAVLICGLVSASLIYTLFGGDSDADAKIADADNSYDQYPASAILSNDFNYGFGKTPKPDGYAPEVRITEPNWQVLENSATKSPMKAAVTPKPELEKSEPVITAVLTTDTRPRIAIIIDDMGVRQNMTKPFAALPVPINFSFLPYADGLKWQTQLMSDAGHELMLHMPMEPSVKGQNPGPKALLTSLSSETLDEYINWNLARFDGFVGINNHMGSHFTENAPMMTAVLEKLKADDLFFIDSRTTSKSTGYEIAKEHGLKYEDRDVFLDNELSQDAIFAQFAELEKIARQNGEAIAIGHPHSETLKSLKQWLPTLEAKGFVVVKVSSLLKQQSQTTQLNDVLTTQVKNTDYSGGGN